MTAKLSSSIEIASIRDQTDTSDNKLLPITSGQFDALIYQQTSETCTAINRRRSSADDGFLSISLNGYLTAGLRWGYSKYLSTKRVSDSNYNVLMLIIGMVGTISPSLQLEEAHGFFDVSPFGAGTVFVDGNGVLDIEGSLPPAQVFPAVVDYKWSHPG